MQGPLINDHDSVPEKKQRMIKIFVSGIQYQVLVTLFSANLNVFSEAEFVGYHD